MSQNYIEETKTGFPPSKQADPIIPEDDDLENQEYEQLSYGDNEDGDDYEQEAWGFTQKEVVIPSLLTGFRPEMEAKAKSLSLTCYFHETGSKKIILMGEGHALDSFSAYMETMSQLMEKPLMSKLALGEFTQKEIPLTPSFKHFKPLIEKACETMELVMEHGQTKLTVYGYDRRIKELMAFLHEKEAEYGQGQLIDQEINISTFHRRYLKEIEAKAFELGLKNDFGYDMIYVRGPRKPVDQLILYMMGLESQAKKALFPQYWDFNDNNPLSLITVQPDSPEFQLVAKPLIDTLRGGNNVRINFIQRIQNKYLMDQFITIVNKKTEEKPNEPLNRMLLFHGTRLNHPDKIYANFDTGFDLQYAAYGSYGKGLYFAKNASYSNGYAYITKTQSKQIFLADVFVGKSFQGSMTSRVKAPEGYDSMYAAGAGQDFYIVYHNFYSYPLYLIDYSGC